MTLDRTSTPSSDAVSAPTTPALAPLPSALADRLAECPGLPSLPAAAAEVIRLAQGDEPRLADFAHAIERDPALTLRLLSLANSALYARGDARVATCSEAVSRLGLDATLAAAMSFGLPRPGPRENLDLERLWQRAIIAALSAQHLARRLCPQAAGTLFTAALIQDIGILALDALDGDSYRSLAHDLGDHDGLCMAEQRYYGCDHALVGAWLAASWQLPDHLAAAIAESHGPLTDDAPQALCLRLSCRIADCWLAEDPAAAFSSLLRQLLELDSVDANRLEALLQELHGLLPPVARLFEITCPPDIDHHALVQEAKQLLFAQNLRLSQRLASQQRELEILQASHSDLDEQRRTDHLTGLANRPWLEALLELHFDKARTARQPLSVMFIDLDRFKRLNDRHGHRFGDRVLIHFASALKAMVRESDVAGRYGGEEFLVLMPQTRRCQAGALAGRIREALLAAPLAHAEGEPVHVTASIGIASLEDAAFTCHSELIDAADQAMYGVKHGGRDGVRHFVEPEY
ncbi:sensor domain-containing diguanylate cyclase [Billgrantia gudaonensis]|uniref:diguanylate cyclase n=1 Tax=Billgrantia gudaonensis TaxID=376427 RepID=A0A1G8X127_9GAMM|nr:GGDEF domain-containing protein [Halomonas gudaonensis]SDJ84233.1 diguanylate cyclase (GGDEF) domain-containing protein [Halomonas gudaonensis]